MTGKGLTWTTAHLKAAVSPDEVRSALAEAATHLGTEAIPAATVLSLLEELALETARMRVEVLATTRAREILLASVAHDLRNPLNTFAMSAGLLRDDLEAPGFERSRAVSLVSRMERASTRMQRMIEDLLDASRIEAGNVEFVLRPEDPAVVVRAAIEKAKPVVVDKGATIEETSIVEGLLVNVDRARIIDGLGKLVSVALKTTGEGGIIRLGVESHDDNVVLTVRGMAPRATASTAHDETRGGLSFMIARGLMQGQGGDVSIENTPEGARTIVTFPPLATRNA